MSYTKSSAMNPSLAAFFGAEMDMKNLHSANILSDGHGLQVGWPDATCVAAEMIPLKMLWRTSCKEVMCANVLPCQPELAVSVSVSAASPIPALIQNFHLEKKSLHWITPAKNSAEKRVAILAPTLPMQAAKSARDGSFWAILYRATRRLRVGKLIRHTVTSRSLYLTSLTGTSA